MTSTSSSASRSEAIASRAFTPVRKTSLGLWSRAFLRIASRLSVGELVIVMPDGRRHTVSAGAGRGPCAKLRIVRTRALRRLLVGGDLAFAEAYMDGDWTTPDLTALIELALVNEMAAGVSFEASFLLKMVERVRHLSRWNTRSGSRRNIARHYDLSNIFYSLWLDDSMSYSSALFSADDQSLGEAQAEKNRRLAELLGLRPDLSLLEIGCGWGEFALMAARDYGCRVTAITLSRAQYAYTCSRVADAGLGNRVEVRLQDYRDVDGRYDRIASIEMFEAVGERYWARFFASLGERLNAGGSVALQIITIDERRFETYRRRPDFIQKYIFPGGMLPSPSALRREIGQAGLRLTDAFMFGADYGRTLALWQHRFQQAWPEIHALGFDARFKRMWEYYLAYCEAGFRTGSIDVGQFRLVRP